VSEFNTKREDYQRYWDDIHPFVKYGCIKDAKFYERVKKAILFKTTDNGYMTLNEYTDKNCDGEERIVYYASDDKRQAQMIKMYNDQEKDVVLLNTLIDTNFISFLEYDGGEEKLSFKRIDAAADGLTEESETNEETRKALEERFRNAMNDQEVAVELKAFKAEDTIAMITVDEQNRRFTEMSARWGGMDMKLPEKRTLVLNSRHPLVKWLEKSEDNDISRDICAQVADLAEMARQPLVAERMVDFLKRSNQLLVKVIGK
jgi:molecular chaperone HtpG